MLETDANISDTPDYGLTKGAVVAVCLARSWAVKRDSGALLLAFFAGGAIDLAIVLVALYFGPLVHTYTHDRTSAYQRCYTGHLESSTSASACASHALFSREKRGPHEC